MGVVKRASTWGCSAVSDVYRDRKGAGHLGMCGSAPAVRQRGSPKRRGHSARGRSVAAKAPRSGIERFTGTWIARWLQKSVRSILSAVTVREPKGSRTAADKRGVAAAP
jgi:hypothetical protein